MAPLFIHDLKRKFLARSKTRKIPQQHIPRTAPRKRTCHYESLEENHIRLLKLYPGGSKDPICCVLQTVNLLDYEDITAKASGQTFEHYDAISYVWGDPKATAEITCNGQATDITTNLRDALRRLRDLKNSCILWADALCINQSDLDERAQQVNLMGLIYWKARRVHVWLGHDGGEDPSCGVEHAVHLIRKIGKLYDGLDTLASPKYSLRMYGVESKLDDSDGNSDNLGWAEIRQLLYRPWFQRVWVVQELGLSRDATFYCGNTSFTRNEIDDFLGFLQSRGPSLARFHRLNLRMLTLGDLYRSSTRRNHRLEFGSDPGLAESFLDVLERARGLESTDPRDGVYAFLGHPAAFKQQLIDDTPYMWYPRNYYGRKEALIQPDYSVGNTILDLYLHLAITCIEKLNFGLGVLCHVVHNEHTIDAEYPSWVPLWDLTHVSTHFRKGSDIYYAASGKLTCPGVQVCYPNQPHGIHQVELKAKYLGRINFTHDLTSMPLYDTLATLVKWDASQTSKGQRNDSISVIVTLTAGLCTGTDLLLHPAEEDIERHCKGFRAFMRREETRYSPHKTGTISQYGDPDCDDDGEESYFEVDLLRRVSHRTFFYSEDGHPGLGPGTLREGDEVWLPIGAKMPFVFRKFDEGGFKILGQTYLHGVMRGEAVKNLTEDDFETIRLC